MNKIVLLLLLMVNALTAETPAHYQDYKVAKNPAITQTAGGLSAFSKKTVQNIKNGIIRHKGFLIGIITGALLGSVTLIGVAFKKIEKKADFNNINLICEQHALDVHQFTWSERQGILTMTVLARFFGFTYKELVRNNPARISSIENVLDELAKNPVFKKSS